MVCFLSRGFLYVHLYLFYSFLFILLPYFKKPMDRLKIWTLCRSVGIDGPTIGLFSIGVFSQKEKSERLLLLLMLLSF